ncbi:hypothetical protein ES703_116699 [subsurface metagenome]
MLPPRYRRNDPRNQARVKAGYLLSMQLRGYDYPIRKLRRVGDVCCVTLPLQVRGWLTLAKGDWLMFGSTLWPGVAGFVKVSAEQYRSMTPADRAGQQLTARKIQGKKGALSVVVPPAICKLLLAEVGDSLYFGIRSRQRVVNVCAIKGGGKFTGSRRTG